jgi:hypothetical protein
LGSVVSLANDNDEERDWLFRQLDGARDESAAKARRIAELEERVEHLEAELKAERQKQFKAAKREEDQPSAVVSEENQAKKRGAPAGHPGWFRPTPTKIDRTIDVPAPASCPYCGGGVWVLPDLPPYEHIQEDLLDGQRTATCYRHEEGRCTNPECGRWARQPGEGEILRAKIGPQMRARGLFLRFHIGLPYRKVVGAIEGLGQQKGTFYFFPCHGGLGEVESPHGEDGKSFRRWGLLACSQPWQCTAEGVSQGGGLRRLSGIDRAGEGAVADASARLVFAFEPFPFGTLAV